MITVEGAIVVHLGLSQKHFLDQRDAVDKHWLNWHHHGVRITPPTALLFSLLLFSCEKKDKNHATNAEEDTKHFTTPAEKVEELATNRLAQEPSRFLRDHASSPIHWQPWTPEVIDFATRSQRLIFIVVGSNLHPQTNRVIESLESNFTDKINQSYVPVLADINLDPSLSIASFILSNESQKSIQFPFFLWLSNEGNPVAWTPAIPNKEAKLQSIFKNTSSVVDAIAEKSMKYVVENSRYDNERRSKLLLDRHTTLTEDTEGGNESEPAATSTSPTLPQLFLTTQKLAELYEPSSRTFDRTGGIPPGNFITTLARISQHPASPPRLKRNGENSSRESIENLAQAAILDPLDGFFFSRRLSPSFNIPALSKNLETQAEMLSAIASSPPTPASATAIKNIIPQLTNSPFQSYAIANDSLAAKAFFWSLSDLENLLTEEELNVAKAAFNLKSIGNVSSLDDPSREFLRINTLGIKRYGQELAQASGKSQSQAEELLESTITKLKARRDKILQASDSYRPSSENSLSAKSRLLTAIARTYAANPEQSTLDALNKLGQEILSDHIGPNGELLRISQQENHRQILAFGIDYATTLEALLEWHRITWDPSLIEKCQELATSLLDNFTNEKGLIFEHQIKDSPLTFPIFSSVMVFGPSTWGSGFAPLTRLKSIGFEHPKLDLFLEQATPHLLQRLPNTPVVYTDFLLAYVNSLDKKTLVIASQHQGNEGLRKKLASSEFDSVFTIIDGPTSEKLLPLGKKTALLFENGEVTKIFGSTGEIIPGLRRALSR